MGDKKHKKGHVLWATSKWLDKVVVDFLTYTEEETVYKVTSLINGCSYFSDENFLFDIEVELK